MKTNYIKIPYSTLAAATSKEEPQDTSAFRTELVEYAMQFEGNPYAWGGTSLTKGTDCSGFTQSVFQYKGISLPRTSRMQAKSGRTVPFHKLQPGDLIFYKKKGVVNHVALYIGKGKVIAASSPKSGIKVSKYDYRKPYKAVSYIS